MLSITYS